MLSSTTVRKTYRTKLILLGIIALAAFLRLYRYDLADVINDEVLYGYRSIGLIDSLNSMNQSTPHDWYNPLPTWAKLSFHDHPPLGFWIQHLSFEVFGDNLLGLRLPSILAGIISVGLVYVLAKQLFRSPNVALVSAAVLAVNNYHVFISRIALQESVVIVFMLLAVWLFLKTISPLPNPSHQGEGIKKVFLPPGGGGQVGGINVFYFYLTVVALGLAILTKYTAVILIPIFTIYLVWKRRDLLSWPRVLIATGILLIILSPVIIYNLKLYASRGHFDFQISYFLGQDTPEWQVRPGREATGDFPHRFTNLFVWLWAGFGPGFSLALAAALWAWMRSVPSSLERAWEFLGLVLLCLLLLLFVIGMENRFVSMLAPFLVLAMAGACSRLMFSKKIFILVLSAFLLWEVAFTVNSYLVARPQGREGYTYSRLHRDHKAWGYNALEEYLLTLPDRESILFVYDSSFYGVSALWYLSRHALYDRWQVINFEEYLEGTQKPVVFIKVHDTLKARPETPQVKTFENRLLERGLVPNLIMSPQGQVAFRLYSL